MIFLQAEYCAKHRNSNLSKESDSGVQACYKAKYPHAEVYLRYAQVLQKQQNFDAIVQYSIKNSNQTMKEPKGCGTTFALDALKNPSRYELTSFNTILIRKSMHPVMLVETMTSYFSHLQEMAL